MTKRYILFSFLLLAASSCNIVNSLVHDGQVAARVGKEKLYISEVEKYIPDGSSPEDSLRIARQYITSWATEKLYLRTADSQLSKEEKNVDTELESYRTSLLRYRYEQRYINDRLDTLITDEQMQAWYASHREILELPRPILKVRFVDIMSDSPNYDEIMAKLSSEGGESLAELDSLAYVSALRFFDSTDKWMDAAVLAREFGTDYNTMLSRLKDRYIIFEYEDRAETRAAFVAAIQRSGQAPVEYCRSVMRENILSERKRVLLAKLEQDLLESATDKKVFVIYGNED